ncbi:hypothetical protein EV175_006240, partial [Coemansia sp. RSA 1933]
MSLEKQTIRRRLGYGAEDEDLERMQQEFLSGQTKPAAKVVRKGQPPPTVSAATPSVSEPKERSPLSSDETAEERSARSDMLDFARSMTQAIKEFQIKERCDVGTKGSSSGGMEGAVAGGTRGSSKKLSLFAQRRLEQQQQSVRNGETHTEPSKPNNKEEEESSRTAATFLPKLMAPVPEHTVLGPVSAPAIKARESGFPQIPVDYHAVSGIPENHNTPADVKGGEYWATVRNQVSQENEDKIKAMSETEIMEAQNDIRSMLSKEAINRLMQRKQNPRSTVDPENKVCPSEGDTTKQTKRVHFVESANDSDDEDLVPPPPPAEWVDGGEIDVDNNDVGTDSEFYSDMKRKYFPNEVVEEAKLAWILGHKQAQSPMERALAADRKKKAAEAEAADREEVGLLEKPISHVRFAFDGHIISEETAGEIPTTAGLHHHGDEPDKPGYTIPELLHLSRSTVPMQRVVALGALRCILHNVNVGTWDISQSVEVYLCLLDWEAELYLAGAICDPNMTQRVAAAGALWTWVVEMAQYRALVRLANGGQMETDGDRRPSAEIHMLSQPAVASGRLVERTFKALDSM